MKINVLFVSLSLRSKLHQDLQRVCELSLRGDWRIARQALADEACGKVLQRRSRVGKQELGELLVFLSNVDETAPEKGDSNRNIELALRRGSQAHASNRS